MVNKHWILILLLLKLEQREMLGAQDFAKRESQMAERRLEPTMFRLKCHHVDDLTTANPALVKSEMCST